MAEQNEIVLYQPNEQTKLEVRLEDETVWLNQAQMAELFGTSKQNISLHISNIFKEGELQRGVVVKDFLTTTEHGAILGKTQTHIVAYYNLDVIISVGYRVKSIIGTRFRQWATSVLKDYTLRGYAIQNRILRLEEQVAEHEKKIDFFVRTALPPVEGAFYDGINKHNAQYRPIRVEKCKSVHDRFLLIDNTVYHIGASIKDLGKKLFAFSKMEMPAKDILKQIN